MTAASFEVENRRNYRKLVLSITASENTLNLLIAICDDRNLRQQIIQDYEAELQQQQVTPYQVRLDWHQPSLRSTLAQLVQAQPSLQQGDRSVVTVLGADDLIAVRLNEGRSEQENFFFSLQWTREALREFSFPIVLWLSEAVTVRLADQAPDFWSWRGGVVEFWAKSPAFTEQVNDRDWMPPAPPQEIDQGLLTELLQQVTALEQQDRQSPLLISLYNRLGEAYADRYDYPAALERYEQAYNLAQRLNAPSGKADTLLNLGNVYFRLGRYLQAIDFYKQALEIRREIGDRQGEANSLVSLGNAYYSLGQYDRAIDFYQQSLEMAMEIDDRQGEANSLGNLGSAYFSLGEYDRALDFYQQQLEIARKIGDRQGEANSLGNLGLEYSSLGQYDRALDFYQQSLEIKREIGDRHGEANTWFNLGLVRTKLDQKQEAAIAYENARRLYQDMKLDHRVERCDAALNEALPNDKSDGDRSILRALNRIWRRLRGKR